MDEPLMSPAYSTAASQQVLFCVGILGRVATQPADQPTAHRQVDATAEALFVFARSDRERRRGRTAKSWRVR
jgi:hypothetical protein